MPSKSFCSSDSELPFSEPDAEVGKFRVKNKSIYEDTLWAFVLETLYKIHTHFKN